MNWVNRVNGANLLTLVNWVSYINEVNGLILLGPYASAITRTSVLRNLTFPNYMFGKGKYAPILTNWVGGLSDQ